MIDRLADDHANARRLAEALADMDGVASPGGIAQPTPGRLDPGRVATNFVLFKVDRDRAAFLDALASAERADGGICRTGRSGPSTHHDVSAADIDTVIAATREALAETHADDAVAPRAGRRNAPEPPSAPTGRAAAPGPTQEHPV